MPAPIGIARVVTVLKSPAMPGPDPDPDAAPSQTTFTNAIAHLYRGEMNRLTVWRQRLDVTSNWAILLATGLSTFTLGSAEVPHYTLLLGLGLIAISIAIEGRRYRHLHHCKWRLSLLESGFLAALLDRTQDPGDGWREQLAADLRRPEFRISWMHATRIRLRRNYLLLLYFLGAVWLIKLAIHPVRAESAATVFERLHIGDVVPSWFVGGTALAFFVIVTALAATCPPAERLEGWAREDRLRVDR